MEIDAFTYRCLPVKLTQEDALLIEGSETLYRVGWVPEPEGVGFVTRGINKHGWIEIEAVILIEPEANHEGHSS